MIRQLYGHSSRRAIARLPPLSATSHSLIFQHHPYHYSLLSVANLSSCSKHSVVHNGARRMLSTTTVASTHDSVAAPPAASGAPKKAAEKSNIFLDNLGTFFLSAIGIVILALVRSSMGTTNRNKLREACEDDASLDPLEIDDLRVANSELTPKVFRTIMQAVALEFPEGTTTYPDFCFAVRKKMRELKGEAFTVELGHLLDRAVDAALEAQGKTRDDPISLVFYFTALSLAIDLESSTSDRIRVLYEALQWKDSHTTNNNDENNDNSSVAVRYKDVVEMLGYLQQTSQLTPEAQVIMGQNKIPTQEYRIATPQELIQWDGNENDVMDLQSFADILRSQAVCAWGECYFKKKPNI